MKRSLVDILRAHDGSLEFDLLALRAAAFHVEYGVLVCPKTGSTRLILSGFPLFTENIPTSAGLDLKSLQSIEIELFGDPQQYQQFVEEKWRRPHRDAYAAFQPFNESTRALYPLVPLLRKHLQPGDYILDTWCRTGWSGELLAALFPEQNIVSLWEGNHGTLGYRAFRYWLPQPGRAENLDILFHDANQPFPFKSGSFAAVVGLDSLHRYDADNLLAECQRVCRVDGPILFPHVHLTNSEPEPWFDRGCRQEHGLFWNDVLRDSAVKSTREVFIESEMALFSASDNAVIANNPFTGHYNALAGLVPAQWMGAPLASIDGHFTVDDSSYIVVNPLLELDLNHLRINVRKDDMDGMTAHMLERHPGYAAFLDSRLCRELTSEQARVLYWAGKTLPLGRIAEELGTTFENVQQRLAPLIAADVLLALPISPAMARLNRFFTDQTVSVPAPEQNLAALWQKAVAAYGERIYVVSIEDELELTYAELNDIVEVAAARLIAQLPCAGTPVCIAANPNLETVVLFWAAQLIGSPFVAIDPCWSPARIAALLQRHDFKLLFTDIHLPQDFALPADTAVVLFESAAAGRHMRFDDWLEREVTNTLCEAVPSPENTAVVIFTSGTTSLAKGVELSHRAVWQSAHSFTRYYAWTAGDVYLSLGSYATMSGLRNPLVATATVGCRFLIPDSRGRSGILKAASVVGEHCVTIMGVVPAFATRLAAVSERLTPAMFSSLRFFLCTAANLQSAVARRVEESLKVRVHNYYGLTETCGACIFTPVDGKRSDAANCIGKPVDAIAQIVTDDDELVIGNQHGELRIYSANLMRRYLDEPAGTDQMIRDGWLYTGDICRWSEDGTIELMGRKKDIIKSPSGALICLAEVEQCFYAQTDISELAVARFVDHHGDDRMACFVEGIDGPAADTLLSLFNALLRQWLSDEHQLSCVVAVDAFPRGANEKIQKDELLRQHWRSIGEAVSNA